MQGKVVVITGATSGIGRIAAEDLARQGARVVIVARDPGRAKETLLALRAANPDVAHRAHFADLSLLSEMKRVGAEIAAAEPRIDVLVNNAGNIFGSRKMTMDGLERTFAVNHVAYFVLSRMLREGILAAAPARIVNTASGAHRGEALDFDDLQCAKGYRAKTAYGRSKLANILFTRELARRLAGTGVTVNCLHPGFVTTKLGQSDGEWFGHVMRLAMLFAKRPETGAHTIAYLATSPEVANVTGRYFYDCRTQVPSDEARDDVAAVRLWAETEKLTGVRWD